MALIPWDANRATEAAHQAHAANRCAEDVEADIRVLMAKHAAIVPRGWQGQTDRRVLHLRIDRLIDEWAMRRELEAITE